MSADPYRWPDTTDILGQLRDAEAEVTCHCELGYECLDCGRGRIARRENGGAR